MAILLAHSKSKSGVSGSTASVTGMSASTAGNLLVALISASKNPGDVTFTPPSGWVQAGTTVHNDVFIAVSTAIYYYPNNPGGITSASFTLSSSVSAWHLYVLEFSGVATTSPLDGEAMQEQDHTTTPSSGTITTTASGDLLVGWAEVDDNNGAYTLTQPSGWTALTQLDDTNGWTSTFPAWEVAGAAGSTVYQPTKSNAITDCTCAIAAFKPAGGGGSSITGAAALSASAALAETAAVLYAGASPFAGSLTLADQGAVLYAGASPLSAALALSPSASLLAAGASSLAGAFLFSPAGVMLYAGSVAERGTLTLTADGVLAGQVQGAASLAAGLTLLAAGSVLLRGGTALSGSLTLAPQGVLLLTGAVPLAAQLDLATLNAVLTLGGAAHLSAALTLFATQPLLSTNGWPVTLVFRDGVQVLLFRDGSAVLQMRDGTKTLLFRDGAKTLHVSDGSNTPPTIMRPV